MDAVSNNKEDLINKVFKNAVTRDKYSKYIKVVDLFSEFVNLDKKLCNTSSESLDTSIEQQLIEVQKYRFHCRICKKFYVDNFGVSSNIRRHLKVFLIHSLITFITLLFIYIYFRVIKLISVHLIRHNSSLMN